MQVRASYGACKTFKKRLGSDWGSRGREFESPQPDEQKSRSEYARDPAERSGPLFLPYSQPYKSGVMLAAVATERIAEDGQPLRQERGIREISREYWRVRVATGQRDAITGAPKQLERKVRGGIRQARLVHARLEAEVEKGRYRGPEMTVGDLLDHWLAVCEQRLTKTGRAGLERNTYDNYALQVKTLKATKLATMPIGQVTTRTPVERTYDALSSSLGPARMAQVHKALRAAFNFAMGEGWITVNPAALVREKPAPPTSKRETPTREQVAEAFERARAVHPDLDAFIATAALTGLRRQALCGLRWSDVDFEERAIWVRRVINVVAGKPELVDHAKHRRGRPEPPPKHLDSALAPILRELRERQRARAATAGAPYPADAWLFSRDGMGLEPVSPDHFGRLVREVMRGLDINATLHSLRHHRGSQLVSDGVDPAIAARELDHGSLSFFLDTYVHAVRRETDPRLAAVGEKYEINAEGEFRKSSRNRESS